MDVNRPSDPELVIFRAEAEVLLGLTDNPNAKKEENAKQRLKP
jgi:hypothetical protein